MAKELERKFIVTRAEWERCRDALERYADAAPDRSAGSKGHAYVQVNYYYDTPRFDLAAAHTMLRVRRKRNGLYLQYKNKRKRDGNLFLCSESEAKLKRLPRSLVPAEFFPDAPDVVCSLLGELVTYRTDYVLYGAVVSLDENYYWGKTDFEIEIEGERDAIDAAAALLTPCACRAGKGKFSRFLSEYLRFRNAEKELKNEGKSTQ